MQHGRRGNNKWAVWAGEVAGRVRREGGCVAVFASGQLRQGEKRCAALPPAGAHAIAHTSQPLARAQVFVCARSGDDLTACLAHLSAQGCTVHGYAADVTDKEQCKALVQQVGAEPNTGGWGLL